MNVKVTNKEVDDIINHIKEPGEENKDDLHINKKIKKKHFNYVNLSKEFILTNPTYTQQFSEMYCLRIKIMRKLLIKTIEQTKSSNKEDGYYVLNYLKEIKADEKHYCVGTIFKKMGLRPSVLNSYLNNANITNNNDLTMFAHDEDVLFFEDETARLKLEGNINSNNYVTGLTLIIKGRGMSNGSIYVEEVIYSYLPKLEIPKCISNDDKYLLFVSGLNINELNEKINHVTLLRNYILGLHGDKQISENLIRLIIVGNSLSFLNENENENKKYIDAIDVFISSLCSATCVDLMPGDKDPSDSHLPQQPFPKLMFKKSAHCDSFNCVTNPYLFSIDNINICCMSGEPVKNITSFSKLNKLDALKMIVKSRILSPTSPDTLGCYPFTKNEPFCLNDDNIYPHIFINGNCQDFEIEYIQNSKNEKQLPLLVCLPSFDITPKALLINLRNLEHTILTFDL